MSESDRELLELAARAVGMHIDYAETGGGGRFNTGFDLAGNAVIDWHNGKTWNPLTDDGDALRLAVKLTFEIDICKTEVAVRTPDGHKVLVTSDDESDGYAATRRAIVRAAAEIGRAMQ